MPDLEVPAQRRPRPDHLVHIYESDADLAGRVTGFLAPALREGDAAVVVATMDHRELICDSLADAGIDLTLLRGTGRWTPLDAEETLASFCVRGRPDPAAFARVVGGLLEAAVARHGRVHVYGEMVALLWGRGAVVDALTLEDLWNRLASVQPFRLLCAYPTPAVASVGSTEQFQQMIDAHTGATCR